MSSSLDFIITVNPLRLDGNVSLSTLDSRVETQVPNSLICLNFLKYFEQHAGPLRRLLLATHPTIISSQLFHYKNQYSSYFTDFLKNMLAYLKAARSETCKILPPYGFSRLSRASPNNLLVSVSSRKLADIRTLDWAVIRYVPNVSLNPISKAVVMINKL